MSVSLINGHIDRGSMTPQEALAWVEDYEKAIKEEQAIVNNGDEFHVEALKVCEVVKQALEKQIPKKVIEQTEEDREFIDFICPFCKVTLQQKIKFCFSQRYFKNTIYKYKFCLHCGQALDWGDTK